MFCTLLHLKLFYRNNFELNDSNTSKQFPRYIYSLAVFLVCLLLFTSPLYIYERDFLHRRCATEYIVLLLL